MLVALMLSDGPLIFSGGFESSFVASMAPIVPMDSTWCILYIGLYHPQYVFLLLGRVMRAQK
jgi:hypothetical protein